MPHIDIIQKCSGFSLTRAIHQFALVLALPGLLASCASTPPDELSSRTQRSLDSLFVELQDQRPGAAVLISRDGAPLYEGYFGLAQLEHPAPINADSVFPVGSVAKQFTAYALMQLAIDGKVKLDAPVQRYLPDFPRFDAPITVAQLLYHSSGLRDQLNLASMAGWRRDETIELDNLREILYQQRSLNHSPGAEFSYTNSGYWLLAQIIEVVSGVSLAQWAEQHIFTPLQMTQSRFLNAYSEAPASLAQAFHEQDRQWRQSPLGTTLPGAAGLVSTARDLAIWHQHLLDLRYENPPLWAAITRPGRLRDGDIPADMRGEYYGAGLFLGEHAGSPTLGHSGRVGDYEAATYLFPNQDLSVVVLLNGPWLPPRNLALLLGEMVLRDLGEPLPEASKPEIYRGEVDRELIAQAQGIYTAPQPLEGANLPPRVGLALLHRRGELEVSVLGLPPERAQPISATRFRTRIWSHLEIHLDRNEEGEAQLQVDFGDGPVQLQASSCGEGKPAAELEGFYHSEELQTIYQLRFAEGRLLVVHPRLDTAWLLCLSEDLFLAAGANPDARGFNTAEVVRNAAGELIGLHLSSGERARNVYFKKLFNSGKGE